MSAAKAVIVTGAAGGIGSEIVEVFQNHDWFVVPLDLRDVCGARAQLENFDLYRVVRDPVYRQKVIKTLKQSLPTDLERVALVNNAAVQRIGAAEELSLNDWDESWTVNVLAPFILSQALFDVFKSSNGRIINVGSIHSSLTKPEFAAYATTKGALNNLTKSLAIEWAPFGIAVNGICPAAIDTPMLRAGFQGKSAELAKLAQYHPTRNIGSPDDVASLAYFLAEFSSSFLTGSLFDLSGGISSVLHDPS